MKTRLVRIGNSCGVRLPKPLLVQAGLTEEVELRVKDGAIVIERSSAPLLDYSEVVQKMPLCEDEPSPESSAHFDEKDWEWEWLRWSTEVESS
jgi:antitoxin MazE